MAPPTERQKRLPLIAQWLEETPISRADAVREIQERFKVGRCQAYKDHADALRLTGYGVIGDQLVYGALALNGAQRCLIDAEADLRSVEWQANDPETSEREWRWAARRSKALVGVANGYIALADRCMRLRPTDVMSSDEGRELVIRAVEQHQATLTPEHRARLEAAAANGRPTH